METFRRAVEAYARHDDDALVELFDAEVEVQPALVVTLGGEATVYRGHEGVREWLRDTDDAFVREVSSSRRFWTWVAASSPTAGPALSAGRAEPPPSPR